MKIAPMKKASLICLEKDREATLASLRDLGVVHLKHVKALEGKEIDKARAKVERLASALEALPTAGEGNPKGMDGEAVADAVHSALSSDKNLEDRKREVCSEIERIKLFGNFNPESINKLKKGEIYLSLFKLPAKQEIEIPDSCTSFTLGRDAGGTAVVVVSKGEPVEGVKIAGEEASPMRLPEKSIEDYEAELQSIEKKNIENETSLKKLALERPALENYLESAKEELVEIEAKTGMGESGKFAYLEGFVPEEKEEHLLEAAKQNGWAVQTREPGEDEIPPTLLKNPPWVKPIEAVFDMIGVLPSYDGANISLAFLLFLSIFFGMLVGDAGYGAIFLALAIFLRVKMPKLPKTVPNLLTITSISTIIWGVLTGNYFSVESMLDNHLVAWLDPEGGKTTERHIMLLCFFLGTIHLTVAHLWVFLRSLPSLTALSQLGWICTTWVMFYAARMMVLMEEFPPVMYTVLIVGIILILLFMMKPSEIKKGWFNYVMLPLDLISNFVDVVSYVRLFAVGSATFAVASAFNTMASEMATGILGTLVAVIVLFLGHGLNILLAAMGVLVHGVRLNTLEFANHMGLEWSGVKYNPFARKQNLN